MAQGPSQLLERDPALDGLPSVGSDCDKISAALFSQHPRACAAGLKSLAAHNNEPPHSGRQSITGHLIPPTVLSGAVCAAFARDWRGLAAAKKGRR